MYKVTCDGKILHNDELQSLRISNGKVVLEIGKSGLFEFTIYPTHPYYDYVNPMLPIVEVYREELSIFRGRVLNVKYGFYNEKQVTCEGELAFLLDSIVAPHTVSTSFSGYLEYILYIHNSQVEKAKQFEVGNITVADFTPYEVVEDFKFISSLETLNKRMAEYSGGYLQARHEYGTMYLDLLTPEMNVSNVSGQKIRLGKNLIDLQRDVEGSEVFSGIVPLGAKIGDTENRLDISSVNGGSYSIVNDAAVAAYGKIFKTIIFENITDATTLLTEARNYLAENFAAVNTIEITAVDLSGINPDLDSFKVGQWVTVESEKHFNQSQTFLIRKMTISLSNPADTRIEVGRTKQGLTDSLGNVTNNIGNILTNINNIAGNIDSTTQKADTAITAVNELSSRVEVLEESAEHYIVTSGTYGIWTYRIYSDGTAECFGKINVSAASVTGTLGNWYRSEVMYDETAYPYPLSFSTAPVVEMMFQTRNSSAALVWVFSTSASYAQSYLPQCYLIRPVSGTDLNGNINIYARGNV